MPKVPLPFTWKLAKKPWKQAPRILTKEKIFELSKDYKGRSRNCNRLARNRVEKGLTHAFRNRKHKMRNARKAWIMQINAGARLHGLQYSQMIHSLKQTNIQLNRKMLSNFARSEPITFAGIAHYARIQDFIKPKVYANCGYIQSAVFTQVIQKPEKHIGNASESAFLAYEKESFPAILTHQNFQLPMYVDYAQLDLPSRVDYVAYRKQCDRLKKEREEAVWAESKKKVNPDYPIGQKHVTRGKVRSHWKLVSKKPLEASS